MGERYAEDSIDLEYFENFILENNTFDEIDYPDYGIDNEFF